MANNSDNSHATIKISNLKMSAVKFANLYFIDVIIHGIQATLMFDTGASITVLNETTARLADGITAAASIKAGGSAGNIGEYQTVILNSIKLGGHEIEDAEVLVVPDEVLDFGVDEEGNTFTADGFLGWDIISKFKWTIDGINKTFRIENSTYSKQLQNLTWGNFPLIETVWKSEKILLGFDSGHTESMLDVKMADKLENLKSVIDSTQGADGEITEDAYVAEEFRFKICDTTVTLSNLIILKREIYGQGNNHMMGLLGADIVQNRQWVIDFPNKHFEILR